MPNCWLCWRTWEWALFSETCLRKLNTCSLSSFNILTIISYFSERFQLTHLILYLFYSCFWNYRNELLYKFFSKDYKKKLSCETDCLTFGPTCSIGWVTVVVALLGQFFPLLAFLLNPKELESIYRCKYFTFAVINLVLESCCTHHCFALDSWFKRTEVFAWVAVLRF